MANYVGPPSTQRDFEQEPAKTDVATLRNTAATQLSLVDTEFFGLFREANGEPSQDGIERKDKIEMRRGKLLCMADLVESFKVTPEAIKKKPELQAAYISHVFWERVLACLKRGMQLHVTISIKCGERVLEDLIICQGWGKIITVADPSCPDVDEQSGHPKQWHITILPVDSPEGSDGPTHRKDFQSKCVCESISKMLWIDPATGEDTQSQDGSVTETAIVLFDNADGGGSAKPEQITPEDLPVLEAMVQLEAAMKDDRFSLCRAEHLVPLQQCKQALFWRTTNFKTVQVLREQLKSSVQLQSSGAGWDFTSDSKEGHWKFTFVGKSSSRLDLTFLASVEPPPFTLAKLHRQFRSITVGRRIIAEIDQEDEVRTAYDLSNSNLVSLHNFAAPCFSSSWSQH